jgi:heme oxygenase
MIGIMHRTLRAATRNDHALLDRLMLQFNLSRRDHYRLFLGFHFAALRSHKQYWRPEDYQDFQAMLGCLQSDLGSIEGPATELSTSVSLTSNNSAALGIAYVIRGSRLGAEVLRRSVPDDFPSSYLHFSPVLTWAKFLLQLEVGAEIPGGTDEAILGARCAFDSFATEFTLGLPPKALPN